MELYIYIRGYVNNVTDIQKRKKNPPLQFDHKSRYTELLELSEYFYNAIKAVSIESTRFSITSCDTIENSDMNGQRERERVFRDSLVFSITNLRKGISTKQASAFKCKIHATG